MNNSTYLSLILFFLINAVASRGQGEDGLTRYKTGTLSGVVRAHIGGDLEAERRGIKLGSDPVSASVIYTGLSRPTPFSKRRFITFYVLRNGKSESRSGFATEILFREGKTTFWLPVQDELLRRIRRELRRDDSVELYAVWVGATSSVRGKLQQIFLVNAFRKPGQEEARSAALAPAEWHTFTSPDADFTIEFPSEPVLEEGIREEGEVAVKRRYSHYGKSLWLSITFQDLGFPPDSRQANNLGPKLEEVMAKYTKDRGGKLIRVQRLAKDTLELERRVPSKWSNNDRHVISRIVQRNSRMYTLGCVPLVDGQEIDKNVCRRFFNSFFIIGIPR